MSNTPAGGLQSGRDNPLLAYAWEGGSDDQNMPGHMEKLPLSTWSTSQDFSWTNLSGTSYEYIWRSAILDLRPEFRRTDPRSSSLNAVPVNRSPALGSGAVMRLLIFSADRTVDVAALGGLSVEFLNAINDQPPQHMQTVLGVQEQPLFVVDDWTVVTEDLRQGGQSQTISGLLYRGASLLEVSPPGTGTRFWQVFVRFSFDNTLANPQALGIRLQASVI